MSKSVVFWIGLLPLLFTSIGFGQNSVARQWNEQCLDAIRRDFPAPTVHARNLYHMSCAMWDAWAAYDDTAVGVFHNEPTISHADAAALAEARNEAVSFAAYRVLVHRYNIAVGSAVSLNAFNNLMLSLGYDPANTSTEGMAPGNVGNRAALAVISGSFEDGSNQSGLYVDPDGYSPVNAPLIIFNRGTTMNDPNRWQPLAFNAAFTQNGQIASNIQRFIGSHWGDVHTFSLTREPGTVYCNPPTPPQLGGEESAAFLANNVEVIAFSKVLDPATSLNIDISPRVRGNNPLGTNDGIGHAVNPSTGLIYAPNVVNHADYGRVVAEFWADGPDSETPPGHWNELANEVADHPDFVKQLGGSGPVLDDLEWDVKVYLALNASLHDAAIAAWDAKVVHDYVRPISSIRHCAGLGQSSDPDQPSYHPEGLPLVPDLVELITAESSAPGERHAHLAANIGRIAIHAWAGEPDDPETEVGGAAWILGMDWLPYQRDTFVTPAFAGYVSGHSTFSRAAAEVLTTMTGSPFWPGGLGQHTTPAGDLEFEFGPSQDVTLQWATYYDAADEAGLSRIYGGIHVAPDDVEGRIMGAKIGKAGAAKALTYFDGSVLNDNTLNINVFAETMFDLSCPTVGGYLYKIQHSDDPLWTNPVDEMPFSPATTVNLETRVLVPPAVSRRFYRVLRQAP